MPLKVTCPEGHVLTVPESKGGQHVRCPQCRSQVLVPGGAGESPPKKPPPLHRPAAPPMLPLEPGPAGVAASVGMSGSPSPPQLPVPAAISASVPEEPAEAPPKRRGIRPNPSQIATAYWFGAALIFAAVVGVCPAALEFADHVRHLETSAGVSRWAYLLLLLAAMQIAYAVYVMQLPDWGTVWVATGFTLLVAAAYATLLGFLLLSSDVSQSVGFLQLADGLRQKAVSWCFLMLSLSCLLTYIGGRAGAGWYRTHATVGATLAKRG